MISQKAIDEILVGHGIAQRLDRTLVEQKHLQLGLFDERNLLEISRRTSPVSGWWPVQSRVGARAPTCCWQSSLAKIARVEASKLL